jgi:2-succinyl-5-enolpyruvyl-6-hydroxy-3-cyclohexene-1-carboxylate synthase
MEPIQLTTDKLRVQLLVQLCELHDLGHVVLSPGSRNAPLIVGFSRSRVQTHVIVDERSAAYYALGLAQATGAPVALVCTSGTALLNYAPAVAEAYYLQVPLLVVSADRPEAWIDQADSQTVRQRNALEPHVKRSYQLPADDREPALRHSARLVNDAFAVMESGRRGPVHINVPLEEPLCGLAERRDFGRSYIVQLNPDERFDDDMLTLFGVQIRQSQRVMIVATGGGGVTSMTDALLGNALDSLARQPQVVVLCESTANLASTSADCFVRCIDRTLCRIAPDEEPAFAPDVLITLGGALISRQLKRLLRANPPQTHIHVGKEEWLVDTFGALTEHINADPATFFDQLSDAVLASPSPASDYRNRWLAVRAEADLCHAACVAGAPWSDMRAFAVMMEMLPKAQNLCLSNGTSVRYHQLFADAPIFNAVFSNRGTSGIDGSTSTAAGIAAGSGELTTLITGDISFLYDSNALWNEALSPQLRIIVLNNGGGGIFRFIPGPTSLEECERCFETVHRVDIGLLARAYGLDYRLATNEEELREALADLYGAEPSERAALIDVRTPREVNDVVLKHYFK